MDDGERLDLIIARLARKPRTTCMEAVSPARLAHLLRLQATVDTLPIPIFLQRGNCLRRRYND